jgi:hypothetical protein
LFSAEKIEHENESVTTKLETIQRSRGEGWGWFVRGDWIVLKGKKIEQIVVFDV